MEGITIYSVEYASSIVASTNVAQAVGLTIGDAVISNAGKLYVNGSASVGINTEQQDQILSQSNAQLASLVENALVRRRFCP